MADAAVVFLLEQVTGVIKGYADLISGADKEFKRLKDDVEELKTILMDTAHKSSEDQGARLTKNKIREVLYEVEDAIDTWLTESKEKNKLMRGITNLHFAKKVKSLREDKVRDMLEKANAMKIALQSVGTSNEEDAQERRTVRLRLPILNLFS